MKKFAKISALILASCLLTGCEFLQPDTPIVRGFDSTSQVSDATNSVVSSSIEESVTSVIDSTSQEKANDESSDSASTTVKVTEKVRINFYKKNDSEKELVNYREIIKGTALGKKVPGAPQIEWHTFLGWSTDGTAANVVQDLADVIQNADADYYGAWEYKDPHDTKFMIYCAVGNSWHENHEYGVSAYAWNANEKIAEYPGAKMTFQYSDPYTHYDYYGIETNDAFNSLIFVKTDKESGELPAAGRITSAEYEVSSENNKDKCAFLKDQAINGVASLQEWVTFESKTTCTVNFYKTYAKEDLVATRSVFTGEKISDIPTAPAVDKQEFASWIKCGTSTSFNFASSPITESFDVYPSYNRLYTITFKKEQSDSTPYAVVYTTGKIATADIPTNPTKEGAIFNYWTRGSGPVALSSTTFTSDTVLYAQWQTTYTIYFQSKDASFGADGAKVYCYVFNPTTKAYLISFPGEAMNVKQASHYDSGCGENVTTYQYNITIKTGFTGIIFSRINPNNTSEVWNQTNDGTVTTADAGKTFYIDYFDESTNQFHIGGKF